MVAGTSGNDILVARYPASGSTNKEVSKQISQQPVLQPNPVGAVATITGLNAQAVTSIMIRDASGKAVQSHQVAFTSTAIISTGGIAAGIYFMEITANNKRSVIKFVKNKV